MRPSGRTISKLLFWCVIIFSSCNQQPEKKEEQVSSKGFSINSFNSDSAFFNVKAQVDFGPRIPGTEAHSRCVDFLKSKLKSYGAEVTEQNAPIETYDKKQFTLRNIIGSYKPTLGNRVLLVAHYDTRPFSDKDNQDSKGKLDGAIDGASGVGILLEIARILNQNKVEIGVDFLLVDLEDYGQGENSGFPEKENTWAMGSQYWSAHPHREGYNASYGILLDMVGHKNPVFPKEEYSMIYAPSVVDKLWNTAASLGYSQSFVNIQAGRITDDHFYINTIAKIPTADIIPVDPESGQFPFFHHTREDNMNNVDQSTLEMVGKVVLASVLRN